MAGNNFSDGKSVDREIHGTQTQLTVLHFISEKKKLVYKRFVLIRE